MGEQTLFRKIFFSIYSYTIIYALFGVLTISYHACFSSSMSTLEKKYHFSSSTGAFIMITDNIATILTNLFIGYYGKTAHKPRWMSIGCLVTGLSVMITALPYFIYGAAKEDELKLIGNMTLLSKSKNQGDQMCALVSQSEDCSSDQAVANMTIVAVTCFALSNFFRGFGTSIYFTYGTPYLDDNVSKAKMPTFFAFTFAARIFGNPIGFYMSSLALKYYENPFAKPEGLTHTDPRWIGAWWIGFLISGSLMMLLALPLSFFPREFKKKTRASDPEAKQMVGLGSSKANGSASLLEIGFTPPRETALATTTNFNTEYSLKADEHDEDKEQESAKKTDMSLKQLPGEIYRILTNPIIFCQMMGNQFRGIGIIGYFVFQTKYLESQFMQSASKASLVSGTTGFLAKVVGVVFGGLVVTLGRPRPRVLTSYIFLVELTTVFTLLYGATVYGPQLTYPHTIVKPNHQLDLVNTCNRECMCENVRYQPVCEPAGMKAYFSPCHAGCKNSYKTPEGSVFTECDCIDDSSRTLEKCPPEADKMIRYATIIAVGGMISGSSRAGNMVTLFRSINPDQKSLAIAVVSFWHSLMVSIPYPFIYAAIFDNNCLVWSKECNKSGNCWLYDTKKLRYIYHGVSIALIAMGSVFDLIMIFMSHRLGNLYDEDKKGKRSFTERLMFWRRGRHVLNDKSGSGNFEQRPKLQVTKL